MRELLLLVGFTMASCSIAGCLGKSKAEQELAECRAILDEMEDQYGRCRRTLSDVCDYLPDDGEDAYSYCP